MNKTKKPSEIYNSLLADMTNVRDTPTKKFVDAAFDLESTWEEGLDEQDFKECEFAKRYALDFANGTAGHNRLMLIAKLCEMLDTYKEALDRMIRIADEGRVG